MATVQDTAKTRIEVDASKGINELGKYEQEVREVGDELKKLKKGTDEWNAAHNKLDQAKQKVNDLRKELGLSGMTYKQLSKYQRELKREMDTTTTAGTARYKELQGQLHEVSAAMDKHRSALKAQDPPVLFDESKSVNALSRYEHELEQVTAEIRKLKQGTEEWNAANAKLDQTQKRIKEVRKELGLSKMTYAQLSDAQRDLRHEMDTTAIAGTARYKELERQIKRVNQAMDTHRAGLRNTSGAWEAVSREIRNFGLLAIAALGADAIFSSIDRLISRNAELSDSIADVAKTTGLTAKQVEELKSSLGKIYTRSSTKELLGLAEVAGRLGVKGSKDVEAFVRAADKINVSLGDSLGDVESVMKAVGKLTDTFNIKQQFGLEDAMIKIGSAINSLGASSSASEATIVDFAKRMAGIAPLAKISLQDILGLGAALDSLGQTSETSSTALSKVFIDMAKKSEEFAKIAGISIRDFEQLLAQDANEAFLKVIEGAGKTSDGIQNLAATFGDLGLDGGRVVAVFGTLANNLDVVRKQQQIANDEFDKGTSILQEFELKNNNLAGQLAKLQKAINKLFVNSTLTKAIQFVVEGMTNLIASTDKASSALRREQNQLNSLIPAIRTAGDNQRVRNSLIKQLQDQYPDFLGNLDAETVTNEQLSARLREVNKEYRQKILMAAAEEKLTDIIRKQGELYEREQKAIIELSEIQRNYADQRNSDPFFDDSTQDILVRRQKERVKTILAEIKSLAEQEKKAQEVIKRLQAKFADLFGNPTPIPDQPILPRIAPAQPLDLETRATVSPVALQTEIDITDGIEEEIKKRLKAQMEYVAKRQAFVKKVSAMQFEGLEAEIFATNEHFDSLVDIAEQFGLDTLLIEELRQAQLQKVKDDFRELEEQKQAEAAEKEKQLAEQRMRNIQQATQMVFDSFQQISAANASILQRDIDAIKARSEQELSSLSARREKGLLTEEQYQDQRANLERDYNQEIADIQAEQARFQRQAQIANIIASQGQAIASGIAGASSAAAAGGPAAPFLLVGYIASMTAAIYSAFSQVSAMMSESKTPSAPSFFFGGATGSGGLGYGDQYGQFTGYTHPNEIVVSNASLNIPEVAQLGAVMAGYQSNLSGDPRIAQFSSSSSGADQTVFDQMSRTLSKMEAQNQMLMSQNAQFMSMLLSKPDPIARFYQGEYDRFQELEANRTAKRKFTTGE